MVSEPFREGFIGGAGVTSEVGGTDLEPSQALGKGKTPPGASLDGTTVRKTARGSLYCGPSEGCLDQSWDIWSHLTIRRRKWLPGWDGHERTAQRCAY